MTRRTVFTSVTLGCLLLVTPALAETNPAVPDADAALIDESAQDSMEFNKTFETTEWVNPDTGNRGTITPTETYETDGGRYCREFHQTVTIGGEEVEAYGTACRNEDGSWEIARRTPDEEFGIEPKETEPVVEEDVEEPTVVYRDRVVYVPEPRRSWSYPWLYPIGIGIGIGFHDAWYPYSYDRHYYPHRHRAYRHYHGGNRVYGGRHYRGHRGGYRVHH